MMKSLDLYFFLNSISFLYFFFNFHWRIVDSQCCVNFRCTQSESDIHLSILPRILFSCALLLNIELGSLCYMVVPG